MPVVKIDWAEGRTTQQKEEVIEKVTDVIATACDIGKERITVLIQDLPKDNIGIAGVVRSKIN